MCIHYYPTYRSIERVGKFKQRGLNLRPALLVRTSAQTTNKKQQPDDEKG